MKESDNDSRRVRTHGGSLAAIAGALWVVAMALTCFGKGQQPAMDDEAAADLGGKSERMWLREPVERRGGRCFDGQCLE